MGRKSKGRKGLKVLKLNAIIYSVTGLRLEGCLMDMAPKHSHT